jgi:hypothetical protein
LSVVMALCFVHVLIIGAVRASALCHVIVYPLS